MVQMSLKECVARSAVFWTLMLASWLVSLVHGAELQEGGLKWNLPSRSSSFQPTIDQDGVVYVVETDGVRMLDPKNGSQIGVVNGVFDSPAVIKQPEEFIALATLGENSIVYNHGRDYFSMEGLFQNSSIVNFKTEENRNSWTTNVTIQNSRNYLHEIPYVWRSKGGSQSTHLVGLSINNEVVHVRVTDLASVEAGRLSSEVYFASGSEEWKVSEWISTRSIEDWPQGYDTIKEFGEQWLGRLWAREFLGVGDRPAEAGFAIFSDGLSVYSDPRTSAHRNGSPVLWSQNFGGTCIVGDQGFVFVSGSSLMAALQQN
jgi:hypothetical protein